MVVVVNGELGWMLNDMVLDGGVVRVWFFFVFWGSWVGGDRRLGGVEGGGVILICFFVLLIWERRYVMICRLGGGDRRGWFDVELGLGWDSSVGGWVVWDGRVERDGGGFGCRRVGFDGGGIFCVLFWERSRWSIFVIIVYRKRRRSFVIGWISVF